MVTLEGCIEKFREVEQLGEDDMWCVAERRGGEGGVSHAASPGRILPSPLSSSLRRSTQVLAQGQETRAGVEGHGPVAPS